MTLATVVDELSYFFPDAALLFICFYRQIYGILPLLDSGAVKTDRKVEYAPRGLSVHSEDIPDRALHQTFQPNLTTCGDLLTVQHLCSPECPRHRAIGLMALLENQS